MVSTAKKMVPWPRIVMAAYRNDEVPYYSAMTPYDGKIVCTNIYDTDGRKYWSKAVMYSTLGIAQ